MFTLLLVLFGWPGGILLGNLLANVVWIPIQWTWLHLKLAEQHRHLHARIDGLEEKIDALLGENPQAAARFASHHDSQ